jgi:uncharacterized membrane protein HdeD (DUF308 family)
MTVVCGVVSLCAGLFMIGRGYWDLALLFIVFGVTIGATGAAWIRMSYGRHARACPGPALDTKKG